MIYRVPAVYKSQWNRFELNVSTQLFTDTHPAIMYLSLILLMSAGFANGNTDSGVMQTMLDAMQRLMTGETSYDANFFGKLKTCMMVFDSSLLDSQNSAWMGMIDYWNTRSNLTNEDEWGSRKDYTERNATLTTVSNMMIQEPCNYASGVAYYKPVAEMCRKKLSTTPFNMPEDVISGLAKAMSQLAFGSAFYHGSQTELGLSLDNVSIRLVAYVLHQAIVSQFGTHSPVVNDLQETANQLTAIEMVDALMEMQNSEPVENWKKNVDSLNLLSFREYLAGMVASVSVLIKQDPVPLVSKFTDVTKVEETFKEFLTGTYIPELRNSISGIRLQLLQKIDFFWKINAVALKFGYSIPWQENKDVLSTIENTLVDAASNWLGTMTIAGVTRLANEGAKREYFDQQFQKGTDVYPGEKWCNDIYPHAKWHVLSSLGLLELIYAVDDLYGIIKSKLN